jgi:hypothetical protein
MSESGETGNGGHDGGNEGPGNGQGPGGDEDPGHHKRVEVVVNEQPVVLDRDDQTGLSIKQAAIAQGVGIQLDFVLSIKHDRFLAIPNDDNS